MTSGLPDKRSYAHGSSSRKVQPFEAHTALHKARLQKDTGSQDHSPSSCAYLWALAQHFSHSGCQQLQLRARTCQRLDQALRCCIYLQSLLKHKQTVLRACAHRACSSTNGLC